MRRNALLLALLACMTATLFHHAHNAEYLDHYPNLPEWLSRTSVYAAWLGATLVGVAGFVLLQRGLRTGLVLLIAYACYGLDGLAHYALAPMSAHTAAMNLSIWLEAAAGLALLLVVVRRFKAR